MLISRARMITLLILWMKQISLVDLLNKSVRTCCLCQPAMNVSECTHSPVRSLGLKTPISCILRYLATFEMFPGHLRNIFKWLKWNPVAFSGMFTQSEPEWNFPWTCHTISRKLWKLLIITARPRGGFVSGVSDAITHETSWSEQSCRPSLR